ncbi:anti-sigma factor [Flavobacterium cyanobacteriorum]|nr:anti-sigma factor [Flavobacterium cyanobacteriorum]
MNREYIESGILELYVFGLLSESDMQEVQQMAAKHKDIEQEIVAIEQAVVNLSYSVSPHLSAENFEKIRQKLIEKHDGFIVMQPRRDTFAQYLGWAAAVVLLFGLGFQYYRYNEVVEENTKVVAQRSQFEQLVASLEKKNNATEEALSVIRGKNTATVRLAGQAVAPQAYARVYIDRDAKQTYVDVAGLPEPPKGKVYQVWALKLNPLAPTSIGIIASTTDKNGIFTVDTYEGAEAFGITLEPEGGSPSPTLEQLYTLGKV